MSEAGISGMLQRNLPAVAVGALTESTRVISVLPPKAVARRGVEVRESNATIIPQEGSGLTSDLDGV